MIGAVAAPPTPGDVVIGILSVVAGALLVSVSVFLAQRSRNWLHLVTAAGGLLGVAGVIGQRTTSPGAALGPWDAGLTVPVVGVRLDVVTAAGIVIALVGATLTLLFERVPRRRDPPRPLVHRALEEDDSV